MKIKNVEIIMFPAKSGDCILLHFIKENFHILIDGGYVSTYEEYLKPYLMKLSESDAKLDLVIVTHIDRDHINGIKKLLEENGNSKCPNIIEIGEVWFNSFRNIFKVPEKKEGGLSFSERGILNNMAANNNESISDNIENISFRDGNCLADLLIKNEYAWNISCQKVIACDDTPKVSFGNIDISILNPSKEDLNTLADVWMKDISRQCKKVIVCNNHLFDRAFEGYFIDDMEYSVEKEKISYSSDTMIDWKIAAELDDDHPDKSVSNQSSIVVMIEYDGKTYLFTGDCPITKIKWKLPTKITLVKLPHHGSGKSNEKEFIRTRKVDYYLISTDGSHNHPSKSIIGNILCCSKEQATIVKNYDIPILEDIGILGEDLIINERY